MPQGKGSLGAYRHEGIDLELSQEEEGSDEVLLFSFYKISFLLISQKIQIQRTPDLNISNAYKNTPLPSSFVLLLPHAESSIYHPAIGERGEIYFGSCSYVYIYIYIILKPRDDL